MLNLGNIYVNNSDTTKEYAGIQVLPGHTGITLKNGSINGSLYYGIEASGVENLSIERVAVNNMNAYNIKTKDNTPCGFFIDSSQMLNLQGCSVNNAQVTTPSFAGFQVIHSTNGTIEGCLVSNIINHDGGAQGFSYILSSNIKSKHCATSNFTTQYLGLTTTTGHTSIGFCPIFCINLTFDNCSATNIKGCCDDAHGMSVFIDSAVVVSNFRASSIIDGYGTGTGAKATGLEVYGLDVAVSNCMVDSIIAIVPQDLQSTGFSAWGAGITFSNCRASNVQVLNAQLVPDTTKGYGTGFGWAPDPRYPFRNVTATATYTNCSAKDCQVGFDTWYQAFSVWTEHTDTASNCQIPLLYAPYSKRILSMNNCSESPGGDPFWVELSNKMNVDLPNIVVAQ